jgi:hypothetical protein
MTNFLQVVGFDPLLIENTTPSTVPGPQGPQGPTGPAGGVNSVDGIQGAVDLTAKYSPLPVSTEQVFYVSTGAKASDSNNGLTPGGPKATIAAALTALGSNPGTILLGPGIFNVSATLTLPSGLRLIGAGMDATTIQSTAAGDAVATASGSRNTRISDLSIKSGVSSILLHLVATTTSTIERVRVANTTGTGIETTGGCYEISIRDCLIENISSYGILMVFPSNNNRIEDCSFNAQAATGMTGIQIQPGNDSNLITGCNFEGNSTGSVAINCSGTLGTTIVGNFFELWTTACVVANSGTAKALTVIGNELQCTSASGGVVLLNSTGPNDGVTIVGNHFNTLGNAGSASVGIIPGTTANVYIRGNRWTGSSTGIISGTTKTDVIAVDPVTGTTAPGAGGAGALPATPAGYMTVTIGGTVRQVPYY